MKMFIASSALLGEGDHDQSSIAARVAEADAEGIEIREELFAEEPSDEYLQTLRNRCLELNLEIHYSSPVPVFQDDATLNPELHKVLHRAEQLGAKLVKLTLGNADLEAERLEAVQADQADQLEAVQLKTLRHLKGLTEEHPSIRFTIENDQTERGGTISRLEAFFTLCKAHGVPVGMTFDLGNWYWTGEDPQSAAKHLQVFVDYIHVKSADTSLVPPQTVAMELESARDAQLAETLAILPTSCPRCIEYPLTGYSPDHIGSRVHQLRSFGKGLFA